MASKPTTMISSADLFKKAEFDADPKNNRIMNYGCRTIDEHDGKDDDDDEKDDEGARTQLMLDQLADLQRKEQMLAESNQALRRKLEESTDKDSLPQPWEAGRQTTLVNRVPARSEGFFQPFGVHSTLQIRYNPVGANEINPASPLGQDFNGFIHGWML